MADCMLILSGAGILKPQKELGTALKELIRPQNQESDSVLL